MKDSKPYPWPFYIHRNGQFTKKIGGQHRYFGTDYHAALRKYHASLDGPPSSLKASIARYLKNLQRLQEAGEVTQRHCKDVEWTLNRFAKIIGPARLIRGLGSDDCGNWRADLSKSNGPVSLSNHIRRVKAFFNWCQREKIITDLPPGDNLKRPSKAVLRKDRVKRGSKMFEPDEIKKLLQCGGPVMRAMILLALNGGLGPADLSLLRTSHIHGEWLVFPRNKTGIPRRIPLWPESIKALKAVIRPDDAVVFRTQQGNQWNPKSKMGSDSPISAKFTRLGKALRIHKKGRGFYALRHVCKTVGEESGDHPAIESILGHCADSDDMASVYRERMSDERLLHTVEFIRKWLGLEKYKIDPFEVDSPESKKKEKSGIVLDIPVPDISFTISH